MAITPDAQLGEDDDSELAEGHLRILATTDLHMHLLGHDYHADRSDPAIGLTRIATLIQRAQDEAPYALLLLLDNGDSLQGSPLGEIAASRPEHPHPLMQAFDLLGYDAIGLGNHDFNFGLGVLDHAVSQAPCPVLCSNMTRIGQSASWADSTILERQILVSGRNIPIRIGLLSVLPPQTLDWDRHLLEEHVEIADMVQTAQTQARKLREDGCDLIIALAHSGLQEAESFPGQENAIIPLAAVPEIDALVAGHTHQLFPGAMPAALPCIAPETGHVHDKPVVMPGHAGSHLGMIDLFLSHDTHSGWKIRSSQTKLQPAYGPETVPELPRLRQLLAKDHAATRAKMSQPVGHSDTPMHSYFSLFGVDRGLALVAAAQAAALRPFLSERAEADLPLLSATAPLRCGGRAGARHYTDVAAGQLFMRHVSDLHSFPNELRAVVVTGTLLRDWLEMAAGQFLLVPAYSHDAPLLAPDVPAHNFDVLHGLTYQVDLSTPPRFNRDGTLASASHHRIRHLQWQGQPVHDDQRFVVALNNYRANGGGHFLMLQQAQTIPLPALRIQQLLRDYLARALPRDPLEQAAHPWRFHPQLGTSVVTQTGPSARNHLSDLVGYNATELGLDDEGFLKLRLML